MTNKQRAHDLALLVTEYLLNNPKTASSSNLKQLSENEYSLDIYYAYTQYYNDLLKSFNRDYPNEK